jgi:mono/diheme cytochrome c family protein
LFACALLASLYVATPAAAAVGDDLLKVPAGPKIPYLLNQPGTPGGVTTPLGPAEFAKWLRGRAIFDKNFTEAEGLGAPNLNADSCRACHGDPVMGGAGGLELNVARFGNDNGGAGPFTNVTGGQAASKLRPPSFDDRENYPPEADVFEQRQTPSTLGLGLINTISDATVLSHEDLTDSDGDGIFGIARIVMVLGQPEVGKFGWKAQAPKLTDFARDAMGGENGITTPDDGRGFAMVTDADSVSDPELAPSDLSDLEFFMLNLGPPLRGNSPNLKVALGKVIFDVISCSVCHIPAMRGSQGRVGLFSDLLLHDVWGPTFRGMAEPGAPSGFFRTSPLWGIKDTAPYMHDGRAETLTDAIEAHAGEALGSAMAFAALEPNEKNKLMLFLQDL